MEKHICFEAVLFDSFLFTKNNGAFLCAGAVLKSLVLKRAKARCAQARWFVRVATLSFGFWMGRGDLAWKSTYVSNHFFYIIVQFCQMPLFLHYFSDRKMSPDLPFRMNLGPGHTHMLCLLLSVIDVVLLSAGGSGWECSW